MNCTHCLHPMRSRRATSTDHPGTRVHAGQGLCDACYSRRRRARQREAQGLPVTEHAPPVYVDPAAVARTATELASYLAWRRPYREGITA